MLTIKTLGLLALSRSSIMWLWQHRFFFHVPAECVLWVLFIRCALFLVQPISSIDWNMDKAGLFVTAAFDQALRVGFVTNVNTLK
eukprot:m.119426 g.119426  ORF g.119426 m.119426 type:complete len:85 (+) comp52054_c0_seq4:979-1233(+)